MFKRMLKGFVFTLGVMAFLEGTVGATPSTQIWIPSTDIQKKETFHLGIDNYFTPDGSGKAGSLPTDVGITYGLHDYVEAGIDYMGASNDPLFFNIKVGLPEKDTLPALAVGGFGFGTKSDVTDYNILYGIVAKTFAPAGRFSIGCYIGNDKLLVDASGDKENSGLLLSWDRSIPEISDKLWAAVDYQGGNNGVGALSLGASWLFAENVSVIFGYVMPNDKDAFGKENMFTTQLDVNF